MLITLIIAVAYVKRRNKSRPEEEYTDLKPGLMFGNPLYAPPASSYSDIPSFGEAYSSDNDVTDLSNSADPADSTLSAEIKAPIEHATKKTLYDNNFNDENYSAENENSTVEA